MEGKLGTGYGIRRLGPNGALVFSSENWAGLSRPWSSFQYRLPRTQELGVSCEISELPAFGTSL